MKKFLIYLEKLSHAEIEIEADSREEAEEIAVEKACEDEVDLEWGNSEIISTGSDEIEEHSDSPIGGWK